MIFESLFIQIGRNRPPINEYLVVPVIAALLSPKEFHKGQEISINRVITVLFLSGCFYWVCFLIRNMTGEHDLNSKEGKREFTTQDAWELLFNI